MKTNLHLPHLLSIVVKAAGIESAVAMAEAFGGQRIYIPAKAGDDHPLVRVGGRKAAQALINAFGGELVVFPKRGLESRRMKALSMLEDGASSNEVVRATQFSIRSVLRLKAVLRGAAP